jgi:uncharacterized membrane protein
MLRTLTIIFALLAIAFAALVDFRVLRVGETDENRDIRALWQDGQRLLNHENPYARVLGATDDANRKYATYFPVFYVLSAASQKIFTTYEGFLLFWRCVFFVFYAGIAILLAIPFCQRRWFVACALSVVIWLFNRWTLKSVELEHIDFLAIAPLIASLLLLDYHRRTALLLLGISLSIKQLAIFLVPVYLIWAWNKAEPRLRIGDTMRAAFWIAIIPALVSIPFLIWGPVAFVKSILFSATRGDEFKMPADTLDKILDWSPKRGKAIMSGMMFLVYALMFEKRIARYTAMFFVMVIFAAFNRIWFRQYEVWPMALLPLILLEVSATCGARPLDKFPAGPTQ